MTEEHFYTTVRNRLPQELERKIIEDQDCVVNTVDMARSTYAHLYEDHGWQPFRLSKESVIYFYLAWGFPKAQEWVPAINMACLRLSESGIRDLMTRREIDPR